MGKAEWGMGNENPMGKAEWRVFYRGKVKTLVEINELNTFRVAFRKKQRMAAQREKGKAAKRILIPGAYTF